MILRVAQIQKVFFVPVDMADSLWVVKARFVVRSINEAYLSGSYRVYVLMGFCIHYHYSVIPCV